MLWSSCTFARGLRELRWMALAVLFVAAGRSAGAASRGLPCNESRALELSDEVQIELHGPSGTACVEVCEWRVTAAVEWAWFLMRFVHPPQGPAIDFADKSLTEGSEPSASPGDNIGEAEVPHPDFELEVRWPRPDGTWLSTHFHNESLARTSQMLVPASRVVLRLRASVCSPSSSRAATGPTAAPSVAFSKDDDATPAPGARARRLAVAVAAASPFSAASPIATDSSHSPLQLFAMVMGGCLSVAFLVILLYCLCCSWRRRRRSHRLQHVVPVHGARHRYPDDNGALMQAFNNFRSMSRRNLGLEPREPPAGAAAHSDTAHLPLHQPHQQQRRGSFTVAWSSHASDATPGIYGSWATAEAVAAAALADDTSLEWLLSRLDLLVLSFRDSDASSVASSELAWAYPMMPYRCQGAMLSTTLDDSKATVTKMPTTTTATKAAAAIVGAPQPPSSPRSLPRSLPRTSTLPATPSTPDVWWSPRTSIRSLFSGRDSSDSSLHSCLSDFTFSTPTNASPAVTPPPSNPLPRSQDSFFRSLSQRLSRK